MRFTELSEDGARRQARLVDARLGVVTDVRRSGDLAELLRTCCGASADLVLLRDPVATEDELRAAAETCREVTAEFGALFVLDGLPGLARDVAADGVHVGIGDVLPDHARRIVGPDLLVGRAAREDAHVDASGDEDVDYLTVGPVHHEDGIGLAPLRHAARHSAHPWFAAGGLTPAALDAVLAAGARRVSVGRAVTAAEDPAAVVWALRRRLATCH